MTDTIDTPAPIEDAGADEVTIDLNQPADDAPESDWKRYAREWEKKAKARPGELKEIAILREKARRLDEIEEASKSEQQKLAEAAERSRQEAAETAAELARLRAAVKHGLSDEDLDLLGTGTPEEIEARAERLAARLKAATPPPTPPVDGQGRNGDPVISSGGEEKDLEEAIAAAQKSRDFAAAIQLKQQLAALKAQKG